jgi:Na+/pantothenate symporter
MEILPPIIFGLFIVGILSTIMSTVDSLGFISAITFGRDIMWRIQVAEAGKKSAMDRTMTPMVQKGLFVMAFLALALAVTIPSVVRLWYVTGSIIVPGLLLPFLMTFRTHYDNPVNIIQLMTLPVMTAIIWFILGNLNGGYPFGLEPFYPGLLTSLIIFSLGGLNGSRDLTKISG